MSPIERIKPFIRRLPIMPTWMNGRVIWLPGDVWGSFRLSYEPETSEFLAQRLDECDCMIDIGANIGLWTVWACRQSASLCVVAIEPGKSRQVLLRTIRANGLARRVSVLPCCVSDSRGERSFWDNGSTRSGLSKEWAKRSDSSDSTAVECKIESRTLDDIVSMARATSTGPRLLVKCDIEGHEVEVLCNECQAISDPGIDFLVELHNVVDPWESAVVRSAQSVGRRVQVIGSFWGGTVTVSF